MRIVTLAALTLAVAAATWLGGWWAVPLVAGAYGLVTRRPERAGGAAALAATAAWAILLAVAAAGPRFAAVLASLGGLAPVPAAVFVAVTLLGALALAWSAATLAAELRERLGFRRATAAPAPDDAPLAAPLPVLGSERS